MNFFRNKKIIYFTPILIWLLSQSFVFYPNLFFIALSFSFIILIFTVKGIFKNSDSQHWSFYLYLPVILTLSSFLYATMLTSNFFVQIILLLASSLVFIYLRSLYFYFRYQAPERQQFLDSFYFAVAVLAVFFMASSAFGLATFLGWNFAWLLLIFLCLTTPLFLPLFIGHNLNLKSNWPWFLSAPLVLGQLLAVSYFLPLSFSIPGLLIAIFFYLLLLIIRFMLKDNLSAKILRFPLIASLIIVLVLLLSSRWL